MKYRCIIRLGIAICLLLSGSTHAQYLPNDTTINDNRFSGGSPAFIAGYSNSTDELLHQNGTSPAITIVDGAFFSGFGIGKSGSTINMSGGTAGSLSAVENATANLSGGLTFVLKARGQGKVNISRGVAGGVAPHQKGLLTLTPGRAPSKLPLF